MSLCDKNTVFFDRPLCDTIIVMHRFDCFDSFDSFNEDCCVMLSQLSIVLTVLTVLMKTAV